MTIWAMIRNFQVVIAVLVENSLIQETPNRHPAFRIVKKFFFFKLNQKKVYILNSIATKYEYKKIEKKVGQVKGLLSLSELAHVY